NLKERRTTSPGSTRGKRTTTSRLVSEGCDSLFVVEVFKVETCIESGRYSIPGGTGSVITTSRAAVSPLFLNAIEDVKVDPRFSTACVLPSIRLTGGRFGLSGSLNRGPKPTPRIIVPSSWPRPLAAFVAFERAVRLIVSVL